MESRQALYQCLENTVTTTGSQIFLLSVSDDKQPYGIELYIGTSNGVYADVFLSNDINETSKNSGGCVRYAINQKLDLSNKYVDVLANLVIYKMGKSYYLVADNLSLATVHVRKEIKYGEFANLKSSASSDIIADPTQTIKLSGITYNYLTNDVLRVKSIEPLTSDSSDPVVLGSGSNRFDTIYVKKIDTTSIQATQITGVSQLISGADCSDNSQTDSSVFTTSKGRQDFYDGSTSTTLHPYTLTIRDADNTTESNVTYSPFNGGNKSITIDHVTHAGSVDHSLTWEAGAGPEEEDKSYDGSSPKKIYIRKFTITVPQPGKTANTFNYEPLGNISEQSITIDRVAKAYQTDNAITFATDNATAEPPALSFDGSSALGVLLRTLSISQVSPSDTNEKYSIEYNPLNSTPNSDNNYSSGIEINYVKKAIQLDHDITIWGQSLKTNAPTRNATTKVTDDVNIVGDLTGAHNIYPDSDNTYNIGGNTASNEKRFANLYLSAAIYTPNVVASKIYNSDSTNTVSFANGTTMQTISCGNISCSGITSTGDIGATGKTLTIGTVKFNDSDSITASDYTGTAHKVSSDLSITYSAGGSSTTTKTYNGSKAVSTSTLCSVEGFTMSGDIYTPSNITLTSTSCVDLGSSGYIKCTSDRRLKKNIENVDDKLKTNILDSVSKTKVKTYEFKSDAEEKEHIGLIAQDLAKNFPEIKDQLVVKDDKGMYSINTMNLIFVLWDALNETKKRIDSLDARLKKLEK